MIASNDFSSWSDAILVAFVITCCCLAMVQFARVWWRKRQQKDLDAIMPEKKELRRSARSVNEPPVKVFLQVPTGELIDCFVVDWSDGGLGLFVRGDYGKICAKSQIALKPRDDVDAPWTTVQPRHSRPEPHGLFIGVKFVDAIDRSTLRRFRRRTKVTT